MGTRKTGAQGAERRASSRERSGEEDAGAVEPREGDIEGEGDSNESELRTGN